MGSKRNKRKKKKSKSIDVLEIYKKIRQFWEINPKTRVKENKKKYNRAKAKRQLKKELRNE